MLITYKFETMSQKIHIIWQRVKTMDTSSWLWIEKDQNTYYLVCLRCHSPQIGDSDARARQILSNHKYQHMWADHYEVKIVDWRSSYPRTPTYDKHLS